MGPFKHTVDDGLDIRKVPTMLGFTQSLVNGLPMIDSDSRLNYPPPPFFSSHSVIGVCTSNNRLLDYY